MEILETSDSNSFYLNSHFFVKLKTKLRIIEATREHFSGLYALHTGLCHTHLSNLIENCNITGEQVRLVYFADLIYFPGLFTLLSNFIYFICLLEMYEPAQLSISTRTGTKMIALA